MRGVAESTMGRSLSTVRPSVQSETPPDHTLLPIRATGLSCALSALVGGMMTVSLREAHLSKHRISLAAVRSSFLLILFGLLALCGPAAFAQSLSPGGPVNFGSVGL